MLIGITGHKGVLAKSLIKHLKIKDKYQLSFYNHNILDFDKLSKWLQKLDVIIHLAAVTSVDKVEKNKTYAKKVNLNSVKYIVDYIYNSKKKRKLIFLSTSHVYSNSNTKISEDGRIQPISYYGRLKYEAEKHIQKKLSNFLIIRLFSYYSIFQSSDFLVPSLIKKIKYLKKNKLKLKNFNYVRDISSVDFVATQIFNLIIKNAEGIINCGSGKGISLNTLAKEIAKKKFNKIIELDKRFYRKKTSKLVCDNTKLKEITSIDVPDILFKYL